MVQSGRDSSPGDQTSPNNEKTLFVVERKIRFVSPDALSIMQSALAEASRRLNAHGQPIRYLRSTYVPDQGRLMCLFEAESAEAVRVVNENAQAPYNSIAAVLERVAPQG